MKVLVVGGGGREHALVWKLKQSTRVSEIFCAPGNAGTAQIAQNVDLSPTNVGALALWAVEHKIDLTVVGPEAPLAEGLVNVFQQHGLKIFGPTKEAARLEYSKAFAKEILLKSGVKTARGEVFTDYAAACEYVRLHGAPIVVKADGLAAGKGVVVAESQKEAHETLERFMVQGAFGESGKTVVIERKLEGKEVSIMALVDGETVLPFVTSQDYKRIGEGDIGANTGGMGAISPAPGISENRLPALIKEIYLPVIRELARRGIHYTGFLYAGVMVTPDGEVNVLEFNCRLGDPETQVLLLRLQSDLAAALYAAVEGKLASIELTWTKLAAACVVAVSRGYPETVEDGKVLTGHDSSQSEALLFHAGTILPDGASGPVITKGGRILCAASLGETTVEAANRAYKALDRISFDGMYYRKDIGV